MFFQTAVSLAFGASATVVCIWLGTYTYDPDQPPYRDTGFLAAPDWSSTSLPNHVFAGVHAFLIAIFCCVATERLTLIRRLSFLWGLSQCIQLIQTVSTRFPDPNVRLRDRTWDYTMYEVQYVLGALFVQFYSARTWLRVFSWLVSIFGLMLLIPTRALYTVDVICGIFSAVGPFLLYHWYVRTTVSISKRKVLAWFEEDAVSDRLSLGSHSAVADTFVYDSIDDPRSDYRLEHFRHPTLEIDEKQRFVADLISYADLLPEKQKMFYPMVSAAVCGGLGGGLGFFNLISMSAADEQRPLHIPLPWDVLYDILPQVPDHTADVLLYTQVVCVLLFALASKWRFTILRRTGIAYGLIMIWRCFTVPATFPPDPSPVCVNRQHPAGTTCGDLIFSGHTVAFMLSALVVRKYTKPMWLEAGVWAFTFCGLLAVITSRLHYTRDVITAILVVTTVFHLLDKSVFERPDRAVGNRFIRMVELDYYIILAEDLAAERENRLARHNIIGRFWAWARGETSEHRPLVDVPSSQPVNP